MGGETTKIDHQTDKNRRQTHQLRYRRELALCFLLCASELLPTRPLDFFMCASHSACRTDVIFSICRSLLGSSSSSQFSSASFSAHSVFAFLLKPGFSRVDRSVQIYICVVRDLPFRSLDAFFRWPDTLHASPHPRAAGPPSIVSHSRGVHKGAQHTCFLLFALSAHPLLHVPPLQGHLW